MEMEGCVKHRYSERRSPAMTFLPSSLTEDKVYDSHQVRSSLKEKQVYMRKRPAVKVQNCRLGDNPDVDEESEGSCKNYATLALDKYGVENLELVETGPIAVGEIAQGRLLHLNFKAKAKNKDEPDAVVKTFFCELIKTNAKDVNVVSVRCLGQSSKLPEKAKTFGCVYCSFNNIHHPDEIFLGSYHNGREEHKKFVFSEIKQFRNYIRECEESIPRFPHPGVMYFGSSFPDSPSQYATAALHLFNSTKHANWEFVKHRCLARSQGISIGFITHINFDAKNLDDPDAGEFTFFAEVIRNRTFLFAAFCECLCPSNHEPEKAEHHGCSYCPRRVHHPLGPGYINGHGYRQYKS